MSERKIVIPLDGSVLAETAIPKAVELARERPSTLVLLRAVEAHALPGADPTDAQVLVVQEAEEYLARVAAKLADAGVKDVKTSVWYGTPAASIIEATRLQKVDLIVMTSHGRSGLGRLILGSVAESVLRGTTTPILLLRPSGAPLEEPRGAAQSRATREASRV